MTDRRPAPGRDGGIDPGLCGACRHCAEVRTKRGSTFYRCGAPGLPKYPPLPVRRCERHEPIPEGDG